jgi:carboxypeptidase T
LKHGITNGAEAIIENLPEIVQDFKHDLQCKRLPQMKDYHSYEQVIEGLKELEAKYPSLAQTFSLGKTVEGRELMALKISGNVKGDTSDKPGVLFVGCVHSYEWPAMEAPFRMAGTILENYDKDEETKKRIDNAEIWIMPLANPDGYEYSRNEYSFWRKNRNPITESDVPQAIAEGIKPDENGVLSYGVDLNRNHYDGNPEHMWLYRLDGDKPDSITDDFGVTSDDPRKDSYRGPSGASENETKAVRDIWLNRPNIKAIVDHHTYGKDILYPWGIKHEAVENLETYKEISQKMCDSIKDDTYKPFQAIGYLPATGTSEDEAQINGRLGLVFEVGASYHPPEEELNKICADTCNANMTLVDWLIEHKEQVMKKEEKNYNLPGQLNI